MGLAENPEGGWLEAVPARFPRCRARLAPHYARRARALEARIKAAGVNGIEDAGDWLAQQVEEAGAAEGVTWPGVRSLLTREYGLFDIDGRPLYVALEATLRRAYRQGLRERRKEAVAQRRWAKEPRI